MPTMLSYDVIWKIMNYEPLLNIIFSKAKHKKHDIYNSCISSCLESK